MWRIESLNRWKKLMTTIPKWFFLWILFGEPIEMALYEKT
jgi:hypothetical protein